MVINNTAVKLATNCSSILSANYLRKSKIGAKSVGLGFISYSIDVHVIVNMTIDMLKLKK